MDLGSAKDQWDYRILPGILIAGVGIIVWGRRGEHDKEGKIPEKKMGGVIQRVILNWVATKSSFSIEISFYLVSKC